MAPFVPRQRKHKNRQRAQSGAAENGSDPNAFEILPASVKERDEKKNALKEALRSQQPKMSSKKKKRLDKYIVSVVDRHR